MCFICLHVGHAPLVLVARRWGSIDHRVTSEADLVLVAVPPPGVKTIIPSSSH